MGFPHARALVIALLGAAWVLFGCADTEMTRLGRALAHDAPARVVVSGPRAAEVAAQAGGVVGEGAHVLTTGEPGRARVVARAGGLVLIGPSDPLPASVVAVVDHPDEALRTGDPVLGSVVVHGPLASGGQLAAEWFVRPPSRAPMDLCVATLVAGEVVDRRPLADGRVDVWPGGPRPLIRHRVYADLPALEGSEVTLGARLEDCSTTGVLATADAGVAVGRGLPDLEDLRRLAGAPDVDARLEPDPVEGPAILRASHDRLEPLTWPLPPLRMGEAWPVMVLGAIDPSGWEAADEPLAGLQTTLAQAPSVVSWEAPASRLGERRPGGRRVVPERLAQVAEVGVDGVLLGSQHVDDAGPEGRQATVVAARAQGLQVAVDGVLRVVGPQGAPTVALVEGGAPGAVESARRWAEVVVAVVHGASPDEARGIAGRGVDAVVVLADSLGPIEVVDGVPVVHGLPSLWVDTAQRRATAALRLSTTRAGVRRVEILSLVQRGDRLLRDDEGQGRPLLQAMASASRRLGTDVRVGQMLAAAEVADHWPARRASGASPALAPAPQPAVEGPVPTRPPRCNADVRPEDGVALGDHLTLQARVLTPEIGPGEAAAFELLWVGSGPLPQGHLEISGVPEAGPPWRARVVPCDGSWGFERWVPGEPLREVVRVAAPTGAQPGPVRFDVAVRLGDDVARLPDGSRRVQLGVVQVQGSQR